MTWKQIEARRETRLWLKEIVLPMVGLTVMVIANPVTRDFVTDKAAKAKEKIKTTFKKKEEGS